MKKLLPTLFGLGAAFALPISVPAQIASQPWSITVNNASTATFAVVDTNAISYQWQFNGSNLTDVGNITGSATSVLMLDDVTSNQAGNYSVVINGSLASSNAVLTVVPGTIVTFTFSGFLGGGPTNVNVQLFDHDKPATVENFIHYIRSGAFTNMFFQRDYPDFVLQGGGYGASNRTATNPPITGWSILNQFTMATNENPPFPPHIDGEFNLGPLIPNHFGTIAMALANSPDSANSAFFFNLSDNSASLDGEEGDFTVFGRILDAAGTNVLGYFNSLNTDTGIAPYVTFLDDGILSTNPTYFEVPVNYEGTNAPANANLVFCDFTFVTTLPVDTNLPGVSIASPAPGAVLTNGNPTIQGTASDDIGLALVVCVLIPQAAEDGTLPNGGIAITNYAVGTTNWSVTFTNNTDPDGYVPPGNYILSAQSQDGAGNLSMPAVQPLIVTAFITNGYGAITFTNGAFTNLNAVGYPFQVGSNYEVTAATADSLFFVNWTANGYNSLFQVLSFTMFEGLELTANFVSNGIPNSIAFTFPTSNAIISTNAFNITGTISAPASPPVTLSCQVYSVANNYESIGLDLTDIGTNGWLFPVSNLSVGSYYAEVIATDQNSNTTAIAVEFTVTTNAALQLNIEGPGTVSGATNGEEFPVGSTFQVAATPNLGQLFLTWSNGNAISLSPAQTYTMAAGLTLTATFISNTLPSNSIAFTAPASNVILSNSAIQVSGTLTNIPSPPATLSCQIFYQTNLLAVAFPQTTSGTSNWSLIMGVPGAGSYIVLVEAVDQAGNSTFITENFTATVDTNLPAISILSPASNAVLLDTKPLTVSGTASDSAGLAWVYCELIPLTNADGTAPNGNKTNGSLTIGTTNWSLNFGAVPPGQYEIQAEALDDAGNTSQETQPLTITGVLVNGDGTVILSQNGTNKSSAIGYPLINGSTYKLQATPDAGQTFVAWSAGSFTSTNPVQTFTMSAGLLWTATFLPSNGGKGISFTYPAANSFVATNTFLVKGRIASGFQPSRVSCQIYSLTTGAGFGPLPASIGTTTWSAGVSNLPPDLYVIQATASNAAGATAVVSEKFGISPCVEAAGTYTGLFICQNGPVAATNSGFLTFTVQPSGVFSGRLAFPAYAPIPIYPSLFQNVNFTTGYYTFNITDFHGNPLSGTILLDLVNGSESAEGTISSTAWSSQLTCYRAVTTLSSTTTPATGKYNLSLQPANQTNGPGANGYATVSVAKNGALTVAGALPDNTAFTESARVSKDGLWPVYTVPAGDGARGMLLGWEAFANSGNCAGQLYWYKAPQVGAYFSGGVGVVSNFLLNATGTNFSLPTAGSHYSVIFEGGTIEQPLTNTVTVNDAGQFVLSGGAADNLKISLSANGVLTGSILDTNGNKTLRFNGVFINPAQGGSGFIPEAGGQTGGFELELQPQ